LSGAELRVVVGMSAVSAMAVDWLAKNLYILDVALRHIIACSLQTSHACSVIASHRGGLRSVAVDPAAGYDKYQRPALRNHAVD